MRISIYFKIFLAQLAVIVTLAAMLLGLSLRTMERHRVALETAGLLRVARSLEIPFQSALKRGDAALLDSLVKDAATGVGVGVALVDDQGNVLAESLHDPDLVDRYRTRPEIMRALRGEIGTSKRHSAAMGEDMLYVAVPVVSGGDIAAVLTVSMPANYVDRSPKDLRRTTVLLTSVVVLLALLAALVSSRSLTKPIRELSIASRKMASGDFKTRVFLKNRDELQDLAVGFNEMAEHLESLFGESYRTGEELKGIVGAMQDGLLVLDEDGRVILANSSLRRMVGTDDVEGKPFWEIVRAAEFGDLVKAVTASGGTQVREIGFGDRTYLCSGGYLASGPGVVVVIHDITEIKDVERLKKDFVINLSHELRTPLTAIKGFLETLEGEVSEQGERFLGIIKRHTDRLAGIVDDLLLLSELEDRETRLELERVDLADLIDGVLHIFEQPARQKHLRVEFVRPPVDPVVEGDRFKLEQVFMNLVANALRYTEAGSVVVRLGKEDRDAVIVVEDTGIGIPNEHLPRVFERFYVVDKSRSRRVGGTGLGLSIVKHIVLLHNGSVGVESSPGRGTRFTVRLPVSPT
jgi:two-component system phosphate regulon sensor histidine kinase PhoR